MQVILTEEEYNNFLQQSKEYQSLKSDYNTLCDSYWELDKKYSHLLVFGVTMTNEKLKERK